MRIRVLMLALFLALAGHFARGQTTQTLSAANQCTAPIDVTGLATLGMQMTGTWSATLQPEVAIGGNPAVNTQVTPSTSATAQSTVTANGVYVAAVGGYSSFLVCVTAYVSGTVTIHFQGNAHVNAGLLGRGASTQASCFASVAVSGAFTSAPINTLGATTLIAVTNGYIFSAYLSDNLNNTWWYTSEYGVNVAPNILVTYVPNPVTSASQTFTLLTQSGLLPSAVIYACKGLSQIDPVYALNGVNTAGASIFSPGAVTPGEAGDLVVTGAGTNGATFTASISSGFSLPVIKYDGTNEGTAASYLTASSTSPVNPTWTMSANTDWAAINVVFRSASAPALPITGPNIYRFAGAAEGAKGAFANYGGSPLNANLFWPGQIVFDSAGNLIFADINNNTIDIVNMQTTIQTLYNVAGICPGCIAIIAGTGAQGFTGDSGQGVSATFSHPVGLAINSSNTIFIADQQNNRIRQLLTSGVISTFAGSGATSAGGTCTTGTYSGDGGLATSATFNCVQGVAVDPAGNVAIADTNNDRIRIVNTQGTSQTLYGVTSIASNNVVTIVGTGTGICTGNGGTGISAKTFWPLGMTVDASGNLYWADWGCHQVRELSTAGTVTAFAGNQTAGYSGDGGAATSGMLNHPYDVKFDKFFNRFVICDTFNSVVRTVTGGILRTLAGNNALYGTGGGYAGDGFSAIYAAFAGVVNQGVGPVGCTPDNRGKTYIGDTGNDLLRVIY
jgi:hypothetical protein